MDRTLQPTFSLKHEGTVAVSDSVRLPGGPIQVAGTVRHADGSNSRRLRRTGAQTNSGRATTLRHMGEPALSSR